MNTMLRQSSWIVTLSLAAIAVAYMTMVWMPGRRAIKEMQDQVESKRVFVAQSTGLAAALIGVEQDLDKANSVSHHWEATSPGKRDIPNLYGEINALAKDAHLSIERFDPQPFVTFETLHEIPLTISCSGKFAQLYAFLQRLEAMPATIWVESMRLGKTDTNSKAVRCELNLVVFSGNSHNSDYARQSD
jgi:Tfp pilus assembly protein PilO